MGGRGSKSGGGGAGNGLSFDASKLSGSEKQKAWAKEIEDRMHTPKKWQRTTRR